MPAGGLYGLQRDIRCAGRQGTEDAAGVKPTRALFSKNAVPIDVARLELRDSGVSAIVGSDGGADAEASLGEIQPVARSAADAVVGDPADKRLIHATLVDEILKQAGHGIIGEGGDDCRVARD